MDILDYQDECSIIHYPFQDSAALSWTNGTNIGQFPNNIILDASLTIFSSTIFQPVLTSFVVSGLPGTTTFNFTNSLSVTCTQLNGGNIQTFVSTDGNNILRLDVDTNALYNYVNNLGWTGTFTFKDSSAILCVSCIKLLPPAITSISLKNTLQTVWTEGISEAALATITSGGISFMEGANLQLTLSNNVVTMNVSPGAGEGLYDNCPDSNQAVVTINNQQPSSLGAFFLENDGCYSVIPGVNGASLYNSCQATCAQQDLINLANYTNRITDATNQVNTNITNAAVSGSNLCDTYDSLQSTPQSPYILAQTNPSANAIHQFNNLTCGIYNPGPTNATLGLIFNHDSSYTVTPGTFYITINGENVKQPNPNTVLLSGAVVGCTSVSYLGLVLQSPISQLNYGSTINDVTFQLFNGAEQISGCGMAMNPLAFNFNYNYTVLYNGTGITISLTLDLIDPTQPTSASTSLQFSLPGYFTIENSILTSNNTPTTITTAGFTQTLNYTVGNQYNIVMSMPATVTGIQVISIIASNTSGSTSKSISITV